MWTFIRGPSAHSSIPRCSQTCRAEVAADEDRRVDYRGEHNKTTNDANFVIVTGRTVDAGRGRSALTFEQKSPSHSLNEFSSTEATL